MSKNQEDEANAGVSLAEFKIKLEKEIKDLDKALY